MPTKLFSLVKEKRYACRKEAEQSVILLVDVLGWAAPSPGLKLKQEQKKVQEKKNNKPTLKNTEQEGAQEN